ncbi:MAG: phosphotransferase family protein [Polyangiaceae bacterium]
MSVPDTALDAARAVRGGEEIDAGVLRAFLLERAPELLDQGSATVLAIEQFPSGHSNLTYLVRAGAREMVLRRPPFGSKVKSAHDMGREVRVLSGLSRVYPPAPRPLVHCEDADVLGAPFYLMDRIRGIVLRKKAPPGLPLSPALMRDLGESFVDNLVALHAVDPAAAGLADLGKPQGYVERQVSGWTKRWHDSKTEDVPHIDEIAAWLAARIPRDGGASGAVIIHNDYKYDNIVLDPGDPTRIIGVLDWEMATLGDPLMDLGTAISYWVEDGDAEALKAFGFGPTHLPGNPTRTEIVARYADRSGRVVGDMVFYFCFALFKTAVVAQQIYYRYQQGLTRDERFAAMIFGVRLLGQMAVDAAAAGSVAPRR